MEPAGWQPRTTKRRCHPANIEDSPMIPDRANLTNETRPNRLSVQILLCVKSSNRLKRIVGKGEVVRTV